MTAPDMEASSVDDLIHELGFGKYQLLASIFIVTTMYINRVATSAFIFTARDTQYRCRVPGCDPVDIDAPYQVRWLTDAIPIEEDVFSKCSRNRIKDEVNGTLYFTNVTCNKIFFDSSNQEICSDWVYGEGFSIVREFNINCKQWMAALVGTLNGAGQFICLMYLGSISDKYGRRNTMLVTSIISGIIGYAQSFMPGYWSFAVLDFLNTSLSSGNYSVAFVMAVELFSARRNVVGTCIITAISNVTIVMFGVMAWQVPYWRNFMRVSYSPVIFLIIFAWIMPESIRWLIAKGHNKRSVESIKKAVQWNNVELSEGSLKLLESLEFGESAERIKSVVENQDSVPLLSLLRSRCLLIRLVVCAFVWIVHFFVYYGLTINSVSLPSINIYMNYILTVAVECPSLIPYYYLPIRFGRRASLCAGLVSCSIFCLIFLFIRHEHKIGALIVYLIAKMLIAFSFNLIHFYTSEMFPTTLRHSCLGCCSMLGKLGTMMAAQVMVLQSWNANLPMILYSVVALVAAGASLAFPETLNTVLPENIAEAEHIGMKVKEAAS